jgi:hypothetical protein
MKELLINYLQDNDIIRYTTEAAIRKADSAIINYFQDIRQYQVIYDNGQIDRFIVFNLKFVKL